MNNDIIAVTRSGRNASQLILEKTNSREKYAKRPMFTTSIY